MDTTYLAALLQTLPAYTEATFTMVDGREAKGMARDRPTLDGSERRWTVNGWEWFITAGTLDRLGLASVEITKLDTIEVAS